MEAFIGFLWSYVAGKAVDHGGRVVYSKLSQKLDELQKDPDVAGWGSDLSVEHEKLINAILYVQKPRARWLTSLVGGASKRPIAFVGPSGTGKSRVARQLCGLDPDKHVPASALVEHEKLVTYTKFKKIVVAPGHFLHGLKGLSEMKDILESKSPPKVVVVVVSHGFHATEEEKLVEAPFMRPTMSGARAAATTLNGFREHCYQEELESLTYYLNTTQPKARIPALITLVNKRDLWLLRNRGSIDRYSDANEPYGELMQQLCTHWGLATQASHDVLPYYCHAGGFLPKENISGAVINRKTAETDWLIFKALLYYRYTEGAVRETK